MGNLHYYESIYHDGELRGRSQRQMVFILDPNVPKPDDISVTVHLLCHPKAIASILITPEFFRQKGLVEWIKGQIKLKPVDYRDASFVVVECLYEQLRSLEPLERLYDKWCAVYSEICFDIKHPKVKEMSEKRRSARPKSVAEEEVAPSPLRNNGFFQTLPILKGRSRSWIATPHLSLCSELVRAKSAGASCLRKQLASRESSLVEVLEPLKLF